jgi:hypothetical protein
MDNFCNLPDLCLLLKNNYVNTAGTLGQTRKKIVNDFHIDEKLLHVCSSMKIYYAMKQFNKYLKILNKIKTVFCYILANA